MEGIIKSITGHVSEEETPTPLTVRTRGTTWWSGEPMDAPTAWSDYGMVVFS